ncbi:MAG: peptidylprolyl isomerase [Coriobacteriia bacterium]|nr:peptidylprolyl isomerase [Coriobacteriia bacterium]
MAKIAGVRYTGTLEDGTQFDSNVGKDPLEFPLGCGMMIPGFEKAVADMEVGEKKKVTIPAADAYGEFDEELVQQAPVENIPNADQLPVGETIYFTGPDGQPVPARVLDISDGIAYFDFNHELAGKNLTFEIELLYLNEDK